MKSINPCVLMLPLIASMANTSCRSDPGIDPVANLTVQSGISTDIPYKEIEGKALKLDVIVPRINLGEAPWWANDDRLKPALLYIHGGGWVEGEKETRFLGLLPFVARGWVVVNINYRLAGQGKAPAAVEDCMDALYWVADNAERFRIDTARIVISGESAGGHLALVTGLLNKGDSLCGGKYVVERQKNVAAIINWFGPTDLHHERYRKHAWFDGIENIDQALHDLSPVKHVRRDGPPIMSIHGDADPVVSPLHAELLHEKLDEIGAGNRLLIIPGRKHGNFSGEERTMIFAQIWDFLESQGIHTK